jgi:hypothetical protein
MCRKWPLFDSEAVAFDRQLSVVGAKKGSSDEAISGHRKRPVLQWH